MTQGNPTKRTYDSLNSAYDFFNKRLFDGKLPRCLITMQRRNKAYGYFAGGRFGTPDGEEITDEIALNPSHFKARTTEQSLSTLVHEMVHLWQHHHGKPSRPGYHNKEWAVMMKAVGLIPSDTGREGGRETGQRVSHYVEAGGAFACACAELIELGFEMPYIELWDEEKDKSRKKKAASKTKYTCGECGVNAWAKPGVMLVCAACDRLLVAEDEEPSARGERQRIVIKYSHRATRKDCRIRDHDHSLGALMLNPLSSLASALMAPPYDEQIRLTWAKRNLAQGALDAMHEIMQTSPLKSEGDQGLFANVLTGYAGFTQYIDALGDQLTRLNGGQPVDGKLLAASAPSWLTNDLMTSLQQQMQSEAAPFIEQWEKSLSGTPTPSLQEAQHEGTVQPQRAQGMSYTL